MQWTHERAESLISKRVLASVCQVVSNALLRYEVKNVHIK